MVESIQQKINMRLEQQYFVAWFNHRKAIEESKEEMKIALKHLSQEDDDTPDKVRHL